MYYIHIYICAVLFEQNSSAGSRLIAATVSFFKKPEKSHAPKAPKRCFPSAHGFPRIRFGWILDDNQNYKSNMLQHPKPNLCLSSVFLLQCNRTPPQKKTPKTPTTRICIGLLPGIHRWQKGICHGQEVLFYGEQGLKGLDLQPQQRANIMQN